MSLRPCLCMNRLGKWIYFCPRDWKLKIKGSRTVGFGGEEENEVYHAGAIQKDCLIDLEQGYSDLLAWMSVLVQSPPAPHFSGNGSYDSQLVETCVFERKAGHHKGWLEKHGTYPEAYWPQPSDSHGWSRCLVPRNEIRETHMNWNHLHWSKSIIHTSPNMNRNVYLVTKFT